MTQPSNLSPTDREKVLAVYPDAEAHFWGGWRDGEQGVNIKVGDARSGSGLAVIGSGETDAEAWSDAASRIPSPASQEENLPNCANCGCEESLHWPVSKDAYKLRRCSTLGCDCQLYTAPEPLPAPAGEAKTVDPSQIREQSGTVRMLDSRFYCTRNGKLYVRWEYAGGPDQCKHGYARCFACPDCEAAKPSVDTDKDELIAELRELIRDANEEMRLIRMKDTNAVYDPTIRIRLQHALESTNGK